MVRIKIGVCVFLDVVGDIELVIQMLIGKCKPRGLILGVGKIFSSAGEFFIEVRNLCKEKINLVFLLFKQPLEVAIRYLGD